MQIEQPTTELLERLGRNPDLLKRRGSKILSERRLVDFMDIYWPVLHPGLGPMKRGWAIEAICEHLEAVHLGQIQYLLIDVPPGFSKSMATNVYFPAWEMGPRNMPQMTYISAAYSDALTQRDNERCRTLMGSPEYQAFWPVRFNPKSDGKEQFMTMERGGKFATSIGGGTTGFRGKRAICDDPHNVLQTEHEPVRLAAIKWYSEAWPSRTTGGDAAFITIMQRVHEYDVAALCIELGYTHLCIPMEFEDDHPHRWFGGGHIAHEPVRKAVEEIEADRAAKGTPISRVDAYEQFLNQENAEDIIALPPYEADGDMMPVSSAPQFGKGDPRKVEGELAFPELFDHKRVRNMKRAMAKNDPMYAIAGQLQQRPTPRGGGVVKDEYIQYVNYADVPEGGTHVEAGWDLAGSKGKKSPYTAVAKGKYGPDGVLYILDVKRERIEADKIEQFIKAEMEAGLPAAGITPKRIRHYLPQDPAQAGKYQKHKFTGEFRGFWLHFSLESGAKEERAKPILSQFGAGNVRIARFPGHREVVARLKKWPAGRYKDEMDALSRMDMGLTERKQKRPKGVTPQVVRRTAAFMQAPEGMRAVVLNGVVEYARDDRAPEERPLVESAERQKRRRGGLF